LETGFGLLPVHAKEPVIRGGLKLGRAAMQNGSVSLLVLRCRRFRAGIGTAFRIQYGKVDAIGWVVGFVRVKSATTLQMSPTR
jgi:hypothetical protein